MEALVGTLRIACVGLALGAAACGPGSAAPNQQQGPGSPSVVAGSAAAGRTGSGSIASAGRGAAGVAATPGLPAVGAAGSIAPVQPQVAGARAPNPPAGVPPVAAAGSAAPPPAGAPPVAMTPPAGPPGTWPAADPAKTGPFPTTTENNVGPGMAFTMFRPMELTQKHPVITWGNGTGTTPMVYRALLNLYASHGFIVIASNSENVAQGTPPPMLQGVTWVLEQDMTQGSPLFGHVDRDRIGATGHSQGAFAASSVGTDPLIKTIAPIETLGAAGRGLHGPALGLCGSMDTTVPCSGNQRSFDAIGDQPVMYAELKTADHMNWIYSPGAPNPFYVITNAWFRVHLMGDMALRPMFYGECSLCKDTTTWVTMRKMMDN